LSEVKKTPDHIVHGEHRLQALAVEVLGVGYLPRVQRRIVAYPGRFVGDVVFVEGWSLWHRDVRECVRVTGGRVCRLVGCRRAEPHEEGSIRQQERRDVPVRVVDKVYGPVGENVGHVEAPGVVADDLAVLAEIVARVVAGYRMPIVPPRRHLGPLVVVHVLAD
jgi:hypothetical protein